ncbi:hypothetical protein [Paraburkholderia franconis]|uniref:hypothetical protein n=1 Tax=Paraburkholderia franconis TaxID=2654983 RepID=UPI003898F06E
MTNPNDAESTPPKDPAETPPNELNKPVGDALPTPVEPGLNQPLPEKLKPDDESADEHLGDENPPEACLRRVVRFRITSNDCINYPLSAQRSGIRNKTINRFGPRIIRRFKSFPFLEYPDSALR